jgi:plastocyanin
VRAKPAIGRRGRRALVHRIPSARWRTVCGILALALQGCGGSGSAPPPPPPGAIAAGQSIGQAVLAGRVVFRGAAPERKPVKMAGEAGCHKPGSPEALSEDLIVGDEGALRNVWVRVVSGLGNRTFAPPASAVDVDQSGCTFRPHVVAAQINQVVRFKNSDPVVHNVHAVAKENDPFNVSLSGQGRHAERFFGKPEAVRIKCDLHAWMGGYVVVNDSPFQAVTGEDGAFTLSGLPTGTYAIEAWHELLGTARQSVTLADGEHKAITITFPVDSP